MSVYMIGTTVETLAALNELAVPLPDPQPRFQKFVEMERLGNMKLRGAGPQTIFWNFPIMEVEEVEQLESFLSDAPIYIQSRDRFDVVRIYEVLMNIPNPVQDGEHMTYSPGQRGGHEIEFIILSEVEAS